MIAEILEKRHGFRTSIAYAQADAAGQGQHRGTRGAGHRRRHGDVHALPRAARRSAAAHPPLRRVGQAASSACARRTHAFHYPDGHPRQALNDVFGLRRVRPEVDHASRQPVLDARRVDSCRRGARDPARGVAVPRALVALSRRAAQRRGDGPAGRHGRQLEQDSEAGGVSADAAGGVDAAVQAVPRVLHDAGTSRGLRAAVHAAAGDQRHLLGAGARRACATAPTSGRSGRTTRPRPSTSRSCRRAEGAAVASAEC